MNRILKNSLILGAILGATTGIVIYFNKQFKNLANSCYAIVGGVVHNLGLEDVRITVFFKIKNTSDLTIKISNLSFDIYVNNLFVTKILRKETQTILSNSNVILKLDVNFNPKNLLKAGIQNIVPIIADQDKLVIGIKGTYDAETGAVKLNKQSFDEKITLKEMLAPTPNKQKC